MLQSLIPRAIKNAIESELELYPVHYTIDSRKQKCYVDIVAGNGSKDRVFFNAAPRAGDPHHLVKIVADLRRSLTGMGVTKTESRRARANRNTSLGDKMIEAVEAIEAEESKPPCVKDVSGVFNSPPFRRPRRVDPAPPEPQPHIEPPIAAPIPSQSEPISVPALSSTQHKEETAMPSQTAAAEAPKLVASNGNAALQPKYVKLLQGEAVRVARLILANADVDDDSKTVVYKDGWDDKRIADLIAAGEGREAIAERHIVELRKRDFGLLPVEKERQRSGKAPDTEELLARIVTLEEKMAKLEKHLGPF